MSKIDELTEKVEQLERILAQRGIKAPVVQAEHGPDYIAHGSEKHAAFLGLVEVKEGDKTITLTTFASPRTGRIFRLEDELGAVANYPGIDPEKAMKLVLQQKVNELEIAPTVPADAPPPFEPGIIYP